jgi:hypothetical protein
MVSALIVPIIGNRHAPRAVWMRRAAGIRPLVRVRMRAGSGVHAVRRISPALSPDRASVEVRHGVSSRLFYNFLLVWSFLPQ